MLQIGHTEQLAQALSAKIAQDWRSTPQIELSPRVIGVVCMQLLGLMNSEYLIPAVVPESRAISPEQAYQYYADAMKDPAFKDAFMVRMRSLQIVMDSDTTFTRQK